MSASVPVIPKPVAPDSVHVWRGFRSSTKSYEDFAGFLGSVFVPGCSLLQPDAGLVAYVPSMPSQQDKPATVPDQTALMFWDTQQTYHDAFKTPAVRAYTNLHGDAYGPPSSAQFPVKLGSALTPEQPYHLFDDPADWMLGTVRHLVGARPSTLSAEDFLATLYAWAVGYQGSKPSGVDGALLCAGNDYVVFWEHWTDGQEVTESALDGLAEVVTPFLFETADNVAPGGGLWDDWPGFDLSKQDCMNVQLDRPVKSLGKGPAEQHSVRPIENLLGAVWKSSVTEVIAKNHGQTGPAGGVAADHPLLAATDLYLHEFEEGRRLPPPESGQDQWDDTDPAIAPYLAQLHHQLAHAKVSGDKQLEAQLTAQLDRFKFGNPLWQQMLVQYYEYYAQYPYHLAGKPQYRSWQAPDAGGGKLDYGVIPWRLPAKARIAVIGDIGTGTDVAAAVLVSALSFRPDAILHLGDVYYSGTRFEFEHRFAGLFETVFQSLGIRVPVFTVPGNHEYFTGALAFLECLDSGRLRVRDDQRQQASYFCLRTADDGWQFLGMDTGYFGHTMAIPLADQQAALRLLHMTDPAVPTTPPASSDASAATTSGKSASPADLPVRGPVPDDEVVHLRDDELVWHQHKMESFPGRSILLSHHQLYSAVEKCGPAQRTISGPEGKPIPDPSDFNRVWVNTSLWRQLGPNFGKHVAAWLWGHEHNLGIYEDGYRPADWPTGSAEADDVFRTLPKGRCCGHAAIPVQDKEQPYAKTYPVPLKNDSLRLGLTDGWYNRGFEILDLAGAGKPSRIRYFQVVSADPTPVLIHEETID